MFDITSFPNNMRNNFNAIFDLNCAKSFVCSRHVICACPTLSHYLNQCWVIVNWTLVSIVQWHFNQNTANTIEENAFENIVSKMSAILSRLQCINDWQQPFWNHCWVIIKKITQGINYWILVLISSIVDILNWCTCIYSCKVNTYFFFRSLCVLFFRHLTWIMMMPQELPISWWTHWCLVTHICVGNLITNSSDNVLSPGRRQASKFVQHYSGKCISNCRLQNGSHFVLSRPQCVKVMTWGRQMV